MVQFASVGAVLALGTFIAVAARAARASSHRWFAASDLYERAITIHSIVMVFLVVLPGIPFALGRFFNPTDGSAGMSRRVGWTSLGLYWAGALVLVVSGLVGKFSHGLRFVNEYPSSHNSAAIGLTFGVFLVGLACATQGLDMFVATRRARAYGGKSNCAADFMLLMCMSVLTQAVMLPALGYAIILMFVDPFKSGGLFDIAQGGIAIVLRHMFWIYVQPAFLASMVAVMGAITYLIERLGGPPMLRRSWIPRAALAFAVIGLSTWGLHLVDSGQSLLTSTLFSATNLLLLIPLIVPLPIWLAAARQVPRGKGLPINVLASTLLLFTLGGLSIIPVATLAINPVLSGTFFFLGEIHFVGAAVCSLIVFLGLNLTELGSSSHAAGGWWQRLSGLTLSAGVLTVLVAVLVQRTRSAMLLDSRYSETSILFQRLEMVAMAVALFGISLQSWLVVQGFRNVTPLSDFRNGKRILRNE